MEHLQKCNKQNINNHAYQYKNIPLEVTRTTVEKDDDEEHGVEVRDDAGSANDGSPCQTHCPVGNVIGFSGVRPPAAGKQTITNTIQIAVSKSSSVNVSYKLTHGLFGCRSDFRLYCPATEGKSCGTL